MSVKMKIRQIIALLFAIFVPTTVLADFNPTAYYTIDGEEYEVTDIITDADAPLGVEFRANPSNLDDGDTPSYEWRFVRADETAAFVTRYEENTTYEFTESGTFNVTLYVTHTDATEAEEIATISITISTSLLEMPNAFSPNGDGINDIYKAKSTYKSITEFHAYIFNRWGQKIYEWTDLDGGWDGTYHGKQAKDGVYFVLVKAKGADGTEYNIKRDVNILRSYTESTTSE